MAPSMSQSAVLALLLAIAFAPTAQSQIWNDAKYPTLGVNTCPAPTTAPCTTCNGAEGHYVLPNGGRCTGITNSSVFNPYCWQPSVTKAQCCNACNASSTCSFWLHFVPPTTAANCGNCGACFLYRGSASPVCYTGLLNGRLAVNGSTLGKKFCPNGKNDPHFTGARGTEFEFNGLPDQSFCLVTNRKFQVNMKMRGYYDDRTVRATVLKNGKAIRTWIKELGFLWVSRSGAEHTFRMVARDGKSQTRDEGFVSLLEFDGVALPRLEVGDTLNLKGGLKVTFLGHEKQGGGFFDVDAYRITILNYIVMDIKSRIAHPLLQTPEDAQTHLNVHFRKVQYTHDIHGIMGQTYREGREQRAMDYAALNELFGTPIAADGENGRGFLDGQVADYRTSSVLSSDCVYSAFNRHKLPEVDDVTGHTAFVKNQLPA